MDNNKMYAHHLLYEQAHGKALVERAKETDVIVHLPWDKVVLPIDYRETRTLVVFDGFVLFGGLPRNSEILQVTKLDDLVSNADNCPKNLWNDFVDSCYFFPDELYSTSDLRSGNEKGLLQVIAEHYRYFVLLPTCRAVVFRYRPKSLSPQGVVIEVSKGRVEFKTTSY